MSVIYNKGLVHRVTIKSIEVDRSNRRNIGQMKVENEIYTNIPCRIVKDSKIMFTSDVVLKVGDVIIDLERDIEFQVESEYRAVGFNVHHRTYKVNRKRVGTE